MWSHNCFSSGAPWDNPSKYFANDKNCSRTALVIWTLDDWRKIIRKSKDKEKPPSLIYLKQNYGVIFSPGSSLLNMCNLIRFYVIEYEWKVRINISNLHCLIIVMVFMMVTFNRLKIFINNWGYFLLLVVVLLLVCGFCRCCCLFVL